MSRLVLSYLFGCQSTTEAMLGVVRTNPVLRRWLSTLREIAAADPNRDETGTEFRKLQVLPKPLEKKERTRRRNRAEREVMPPRAERMPVDQDWPSVWPTAMSFKESVVPLPVRMGFQKMRSKQPIPSKHANLELMKIPNFLHLTPTAIKRHCEAIRQFCTPWPDQLDSEEACRKHFPLELEYSDYCHSGPSIRDPRSRIVTLRLKLSSMPLNYHARDKIIRLLHNRYDKRSDSVTILTDRCPARHQNISYALYLLSVLFHESWKFENWEKDKTEDDMEKFFWEGSKSQKAIVDVIKRMKVTQEAVASSSNVTGDDSAVDKLKRKHTFPEYLENLPKAPSDEDVLSLQVVRDYYRTWDRYRNEPESVENLNAYGKCVRKILGFPDDVN